MSRNAFCSHNGFPYRGFAAISSTGRSFAFTEVQGYPKTTILIELQIFQLAFAYANPQALFHADRYLSLIGTLAFGLA